MSFPKLQQIATVLEQNGLSHLTPKLFDPAAPPAAEIAPEKKPVITTASFHSDTAWADMLASLDGKQGDPALLKMRGIATMRADAKSFNAFQKAAAGIADKAMRAKLNRFFAKVKRGRYDKEFKSRYGRANAGAGSIAAETFDRFRKAFDQTGKSSASAHEVTPSRETVHLAQRILTDLAKGKSIPHSSAEQIRRQLDDLKEKLTDDLHQNWNKGR